MTRKFLLKIIPPKGTYTQNIMKNFNHFLSKNGVQAIKVNFDQEKYARDTSNQTLESQIDQIWEKKISANPKLFNGEKFRLSSISLGHNGPK